jgi:hypothetical protein
VVIDGQPGPRVDQMLYPAATRLAFDERGALSYLAVDGEAIKRFQHPAMQP